VNRKEKPGNMLYAIEILLSLSNSVDIHMPKFHLSRTSNQRRFPQFDILVLIQDIPVVFRIPAFQEETVRFS
jgi:hypothetical protein